MQSGIFLKMDEPIKSRLSDIGVGLVKRFNLPFIFDGTDAMRAFGNIEYDFFFIGSCPYKI